jgi:hypothetical protein
MALGFGLLAVWLGVVVLGAAILAMGLADEVER